MGYRQDELQAMNNVWDHLHVQVGAREVEDFSDVEVAGIRRALFFLAVGVYDYL
jgi:hypothetical protein